MRLRLFRQFVIRVYDVAGNVIETHEHAGDFQTVVSVTRETKSRHAEVGVTADCEARCLVFVGAAQL